MEIIRDIFDYNCDMPMVVSVGKFDGVHKGHKLLCSQMEHFARRGMLRCMVTFDVPPAAKIDGSIQQVLISEDEREKLLEKSGMDIICILKFDDEMRQKSPEDFIRMLCDHLCMRAMVVGNDFRFGYNGSGNSTVLLELSDKYNFTLEILDKLKAYDTDISSTEIRRLISEGDLERANELLGYDYYVYGKVIHGNHIGTKLGVPTINIAPPEEKLLPPYGVYASKVKIKGRTYHAVTNVGLRPTVTDDETAVVESHILDYSDNIYEEYAQVSFLKYIREEEKFKTTYALGQQIQSDIKEVLAYFKK